MESFLFYSGIQTQMVGYMRDEIYPCIDLTKFEVWLEESYSKVPKYKVDAQGLLGIVSHDVHSSDVQVLCTTGCGQYAVMMGKMAYKRFKRLDAIKPTDCMLPVMQPVLRSKSTTTTIVSTKNDHFMCQVPLDELLSYLTLREYEFKSTKCQGLSAITIYDNLTLYDFAWMSRCVPTGQRNVIQRPSFCSLADAQAMHALTLAHTITFEEDGCEAFKVRGSKVFPVSGSLSRALKDGNLSDEDLVIVAAEVDGTFLGQVVKLGSPTTIGRIDDREIALLPLRVRAARRFGILPRALKCLIPQKYRRSWIQRIAKEGYDFSVYRQELCGCKIVYTSSHFNALVVSPSEEMGAPRVTSTLSNGVNVSHSGIDGLEDALEKDLADVPLSRYHLCFNVEKAYALYNVRTLLAEKGYVETTVQKDLTGIEIILIQLMERFSLCIDVVSLIGNFYRYSYVL
jgi:hypothetical protein